MTSPEGPTPTVGPSLPALEFEDRPSGSKLGIFTLPSVNQSVAPFTLARISVPVGVRTAEDHHEVREIWLVQSGSGLAKIDGIEIRISPGDSLYFESFRKHQLLNDGSEPVEIISIWWRP
jgi:mannose-6-phosphate isomerase-like protein (cupin superfamily)